MEIKERKEIMIMGTPIVAPGYYYDHENKTFSQAQDLQSVKTEKADHIKFNITRKNEMDNLKTKKIFIDQKWVNDYVKEKPLDAILIQAVKSLEERVVEVPGDSEVCRVLSLFYKYHANLLLCFNEEISEDLLKTFDDHLNITYSQSSYSVLPKSLVDTFLCGYIYQNYSKPGIRFYKFNYGVKEFCSLIQKGIISTIPLTAVVGKPSSSHNSNSCLGGFKANIESESKKEVQLLTKNAVGTMMSDNVPNVHSKEILKQSSVGRGLTKSAGVKGEIPNTPGLSLGRGRGTVKGRGNSIGSSIQNKESTTRVGESRTKDSIKSSMVQELENFCGNNSIEFGNTPVKSLNSNSTNVKKVTTNIGDVNVEYLNEQYEGKKGTDMVNLHTCGLDTSGGNRHQDNGYMVTHSDSSKHQDNGYMVSHSDSSNVLRRDHVRAGINSSSKQNIIQENISYQINVTEQKEGQVIYGEKYSRSNLSNCKGSLTMAVECYKTIQEDNDNKSEKGTHKLENPKNEMSIQQNSHNKSVCSNVQVPKNSTYSTLHSELQEGSNDKPAFNTRSGNVKKETVPAKELQRGDIKKSEYDMKLHDTKVKDTSTSKVTVKDTDLKKSSQRQNCKSTICENAENKIGPNKEIKKSKNAEKKAGPNMHSQVEMNNVRPKELVQGLMCNEDQDEKSFLKIRKQDNCKVQICKEKPQMKSTFLEADKTTDDMLGFQRKYYGIVNDTSLEKVILLLGASGSGKTTLVNLAANYFKEKKSADEELYHVVTTSPTSEITAYTFCSAPDEIPITIIDTPGLNDSSGAEVRDHIQSLKTFLANASASEFQIHAIGFVAQAYLVRLTSSERLVMDYVSTIFGQGVKDHLITLVTFADNQDNPPVVEAMKNYGVSFKLSLKFNNSALHNNKAEEVDDIDRVYWRICWRNWKKCMKTLRDMSPLSVSTMKAVHSEVFASTILKSTERDLTASLKTFFGYSKEDRISSKESSKVVAEIWNLAAVLHHFRSVNNCLHSKREDILIEIGTEICKAKQISAKENICFLSLGPETPLIVSGLQVIQTMASLYKQSKSWHTKSNTLSRNITEWTYCHICDKDHKMNRLERGTLKKWVRLEEDVVALKCTNCKCAGEVHGVSKTKSPFHPDIVLEKTYTALQNVIRQYSIPNFPIREDWYLEFLNQHCLEHTDFIKDIRTLIKK